MQNRGIVSVILNLFDEFNKMLFLSGPRQSGKTTLAKHILGKYQGIYVNWDILTDQKKIISNPYFYEELERKEEKMFLVILDEIHKYQNWKNYLKGAYDKDHENFYYMVTGSGKLDLFKKGGDSLLGRYISLPVFPFTLGELSHKQYLSYKNFKNFFEEIPQVSKEDSEHFNLLLKFSGFPEPLLKGSEMFHRIWMSERKKRLVREDIRDASNIRNISLLEVLTNFLPDRVGSLLSINALREDIGVAFETVRDWIILLNQFYYSFTITPYSASLSRTLKKEQKLYLYDYTEIEKEGTRFENLLAIHLYKSTSLWNSLGDGDIQLHYLRDKEKREVDFVIVNKKKAEFLIECKLSDLEISSSLFYYQEKLGTKYAIQITGKKNIYKKIKTKTGIVLLISADRFLKILN